MSENPDRIVCFCHHVMKSEIEALIRARKADSIEAIQDQLKASTGCGGCEFEVMEILQTELAKLKSGQSQAS